MCVCVLTNACLKRILGKKWKSNKRGMQKSERQIPQAEGEIGLVIF